MSAQNSQSGPSWDMVFQIVDSTLRTHALPGMNFLSAPSTNGYEIRVIYESKNEILYYIHHNTSNYELYFNKGVLTPVNEFILIPVQYFPPGTRIESIFGTTILSHFQHFMQTGGWNRGLNPTTPQPMPLSVPQQVPQQTLTPKDVLKDLSMACLHFFELKYTNPPYNFRIREDSGRFIISGYVRNQPNERSVLHDILNLHVLYLQPLIIRVDRVMPSPHAHYFDLNAQDNEISTWTTLAIGELNKWLGTAKSIIPFVLQGDAEQNTISNPVPAQASTQVPSFTQQPSAPVQYLTYPPELNDPLFFDQMHQYHEKVREIDEVLEHLVHKYAVSPGERQKIQSTMDAVNTKIKMLIQT